MAKDKTETRFSPAATFEVRAEGEGKRRKIVGHVAVFNEWSPVYGDFRERIDPAFFDDMLADETMDVRALYNHDRNFVLGRRGNGTLRLDKDDNGLLMDNDPPDTSYARDVVNLLERGDVAGGSFSFRLPEDGTGDKWEKGKDGIMERTLLRAEWIGDVGPVCEPFYPNTAVAARSLDHWRAEHEAREAEAEAASVESGEVETEEPAAAASAEAEPTSEAVDQAGAADGDGEAAESEPQGAAPVEARDEEPEPEPVETLSLRMAKRWQKQAAARG